MPCFLCKISNSNIKDLRFVLSFVNEIHSSEEWRSFILELESPQKGIIHKYASIPRLYQGTQSVSLIEIDPGAGLKVDIAVSGEMKETSRIASEHRGIAAINGSYFDMKRGNSVCFLKVGNQVVDTTTLSECKLRVRSYACT